MTFGTSVLDWPDIACRRGHQTHDAELVQVDLSRTSFDDYAPVPARLARRFSMYVWPGHAEEGPYCPACCAISEGIRLCGIHEQRETILTLTACLGHFGEVMLDFGAHVGWFTLLAASCGLDVIAVDADQENLRLLRESARLNGWARLVNARRDRVSPDSPPWDLEKSTQEHVRLVKVDVEGAEDQVLRVLRPLLETGRVDHLLVEVTPRWCDVSYVRDLVELGYRVYRLPDKARPPVTLDDPDRDLAPYRVGAWASWNAIEAWLIHEGQTDLWFVRDGATFR